MTIEWLPGAIIDLQRLREFLLPLNSEAARKAVVAIQGAAKLLAIRNYMGIPVEDMPDYHDVIIPFGSAGYLLRYRIEGDKIFIVALKQTKVVGFSCHP